MAPISAALQGRTRGTKLQRAVEAAVTEERERCACVADAWAMVTADDRSKEQLCRAIAAQIRRG